MAYLKLRDRDAIVTKDKLIFRVFGYAHPRDAYICDIEYAPAEIFRSDNPKAPRGAEKSVFYKFYEDEGWRLIQKRLRQYMIFHEMLQKNVVGVKLPDIAEVRKPDEALKSVLERRDKDELLKALQKVLVFSVERSRLLAKDFGVFGSVLQGFHHPKFSDIDLIVYGEKNTSALRETLSDVYEEKDAPLKNEFQTDVTIAGKHWRFRNFSAQEFMKHQRRKLIYALFKDCESGRVIKTEFEPVKSWSEIQDNYDPEGRIVQKGWVKMVARIVNDKEGLFMPSIYGIEPLTVLEGSRNAIEARQIISYMEEFRLQAFRDEKVYVEGNLEEVLSSKGTCLQIALTYCPRYYEQVMKVV
ncbi:nucleotidyltransferase domain-containing protein [Candidatus Bathyarchaeota archaeon]|nr:nucleotidyltransferase domain-containing protein [Candidatus Bathyarchaeota archaeon]